MCVLDPSPHIQVIYVAGSKKHKVWALSFCVSDGDTDSFCVLCVLINGMNTLYYKTIL